MNIPSIFGYRINILQTEAHERDIRVNKEYYSLFNMKLAFAYSVLYLVSNLCMAQVDSFTNYSQMYSSIYYGKGLCYEYRNDYKYFNGKVGKYCNHISNDIINGQCTNVHFYSSEFIGSNISDEESNSRYKSLQGFKKLKALSYKEDGISNDVLERFFNENNFSDSEMVISRKGLIGCTLQRLVDYLPYPDSLQYLEYVASSDAINLDLSLLTELVYIDLEFTTYPLGTSTYKKVYDKSKYMINSKNLRSLKHIKYKDYDNNNIGLQEFIQQLPNPDSLESLTYYNYYENNDIDLSRLTNLKDIVLVYESSSADRKKVFDISKFKITSKKLKSLNLYSYYDYIDSSLYNLKSIECLNLHTNIEYLPDGISKMDNLKSINLNSSEQESPSSIKSLPQDIGNIPQLNTFKCEFCCNLADLPESFGNATNMETLFLTFMDSMKEFPVQTFQLKNLKNLIIDNKMIALLPSLDSKLKNKNVKTVIILRHNNGVGDYHLRYTQNDFKFSEKLRNKFKYEPILRKRFPNATIVFDAY